MQNSLVRTIFDNQSLVIAHSDQVGLRLCTEAKHHIIAQSRKGPHRRRGSYRQDHICGGKLTDGKYSVVSWRGVCEAGVVMAQEGN